MEEKRPSIIESPRNPRIKHALRLRSSSFRRKSGLFLIDGWKEIELAADSVEIKYVFVGVDDDVPATLLRLPLQRVAQSVLERLSFGQRSATPVAVGVTPDFELSADHVAGSELVLVLDRTEKPGNLGACLRSADAAGADLVLLTNPICEVLNPNTIRASRGSVFNLSIAICDVEQAIETLHTGGFTVCCSRVDASSSLWSFDFRGRKALVFGNETDGLGQEWQVPGVLSFSIPMVGAADSLNLSISAAVTMFEAQRQRTSI